jgi:hypothetical protein
MGTAADSLLRDCRTRRQRLQFLAALQAGHPSRPTSSSTVKPPTGCTLPGRAGGGSPAGLVCLSRRGGPSAPRAMCLYSFINVSAGSDLQVRRLGHAARQYSLMPPPRTFPARSAVRPARRDQEAAGAGADADDVGCSRRVRRDSISRSLPKRVTDLMQPHATMRVRRSKSWPGPGILFGGAAAGPSGGQDLKFMLVSELYGRCP